MMTRLEKLKVCDQCWSVGMTDPYCVCANGNYTTIELEFEVCACCGNLTEDGSPAETPFNEEQLKKQKEK
jgi:hypothetical protein